MDQLPSLDLFKLLRAPDATEALDAESRLEAKARLRFAVAQALVQGRVLFHFQPVVQARNPREPAFFEMLARMRMPKGELLSAGAFLPAVEAGPLGRAIDRLALAHALRAPKSSRAKATPASATSATFASTWSRSTAPSCAACTSSRTRRCW